MQRPHELCDAIVVTQNAVAAEFEAGCFQVAEERVFVPGLMVLDTQALN